jgi:hypothetical protein
MREFYTANAARYPRYLQLFEEEVKSIEASLTYVP